MGAYKYLVALMILLLVNKSLTKPDYERSLTTPLLSSDVILGGKRYYFETLLRANWYEALRVCRSRDMHLVSIASQEENERLEAHIRDMNLGNERFWTSGTDLAEEGSFFWMANGRRITYTNWANHEPNNLLWDGGENCLELWNSEGRGFTWNDKFCNIKNFFICEVQ